MLRHESLDARHRITVIELLPCDEVILDAGSWPTRIKGAEPGSTTTGTRRTTQQEEQDSASQSQWLEELGDLAPLDREEIGCVA